MQVALLQLHEMQESAPLHRVAICIPRVSQILLVASLQRFPLHLLFAGPFLGHPYKIGARHSQQKRAFCVKELWEAREKPKPLQLARCLGDGGSADQNGALQGAHQAATGESACKALGITGAHRIWSLAECAKVNLCLNAALLLVLSAVSSNLHLEKIPLLPPLARLQRFLPLKGSLHRC